MSEEFNPEIKPQMLQLQPNKTDDKCWVAEITGDDPTFRLKREFLLEDSAGWYAIYDGYYQIHGECPGVSPFTKEYCVVQDGHMRRYLNSREVMASLPQIIAAEPVRMGRLRHQILEVLDEIKTACPHEQVEEAIDRQKEDIDMVDTSEQLRAGLAQIKKQKEDIIKQLQQRYQQEE